MSGETTVIYLKCTNRGLHPVRWLCEVGVDPTGEVRTDLSGVQLSPPAGWRQPHRGVARIGRYVGPGADTGAYRVKCPSCTEDELVGHGRLRRLADAIRNGVLAPDVDISRLP